MSLIAQTTKILIILSLITYLGWVGASPIQAAQLEITATSDWESGTSDGVWGGNQLMVN